MGRTKKGRPVSGWLVIDKPAGITSTAVVNKVKWALQAQKAGHAGTLDPAATGVLAVALGEATKTVPYITDALKCYRFVVRLGAATTTDDAEGTVLETRDTRPDDAAVAAALAAFRGEILQVPPQFSAVKVEGERAYDLAREGVEMDLAARSLWVERLENPGSDLVSMLAHGEATKNMEPLDHLGNLLLLIVGGNDTTRNTMTSSVYGLNKYPDQYDKLIADPGLISNLVPEIIRWQTPLSYMRRTANNDREIGGKQIRKNDQILMWYLSANRDETVFDNADAIDLERPNADRHLSFGYGIHFCMGSRLAEMQLRVLWEEALQRFERIEVQAEPELTAFS